jgi:ATP-dependent DNA helicase RecG
MEEMRVEAVVNGLRREERAEYPRFAVREALVNAVCHRDYRLSGRRVEIRMYEDRLEVISPGGLPGYITLDNIVDEHFSRNPRLVAGLFQWGYIEELGLGIDRMIEEMLQHGHAAPDFEAKPYSFTVRLHNTIERIPSRKSWPKNMNERQMKAMSFVEQEGRITNREYRQLCPEVNPETLRLDLVDLVDKGLLLKIGDKKGTYYILK